MKRTLVYIVSFLSLSSYAQDFLNINPEESFHTAVNIYSDFRFNSNAITNRFAEDFYYSSYLTQEIRQKNEERLQKSNLAGAINQQHLYVYHIFDSAYERKKQGFLAGFSHQNFSEIAFNDNFFRLYFFGNQPYAGKEQSLSNSGFRQLSFQQFKGGYFQINQRSNKSIIWGVNIGFNKGQQLTDVRFNEASLYTDPNATYIQLDYNGSWKQSDTAKTGFWAFNAIGLSLDFFFKSQYDNGTFIHFEIANAGYLNWNKESFHSVYDTSMFFQGWDVENIFQLNSLFFQEKINDSIYSQFQYVKSGERYLQALPLHIKLEIGRKFGDHFELGIRGEHWLNTYFKPAFSINPSFYWNPNFKTSFLLSYGGYGAFNYGLELQTIASNFILKLGSRYADGLIWMDNRSGLDYYVNAMLLF